MLCGLRWLTAGMKKQERTLFEAPLFETLSRTAERRLQAPGPTGRTQLSLKQRMTSLIPAQRMIVIPVHTMTVILVQRVIVIPAKAGIHLLLTQQLPVAQVCNLRPAATGLQPASGSEGLQPASGSAGLQPVSGSVGLQPASDSAGPQPASGQGNNPPTPDNTQSGTTEFATLWHNARAIADRETFLHWEAAFPGVWKQWQDSHPRGGFDAVIGNPPWDRIKLQEVEWFATRAPELARAPTAAARRAAIQELRAQGNPLAAAFR